MNYIKSSGLILFIFFSTVLAFNCTKLHETAGANLTPEQITANNSSAAILLQGTYASLEFTFTSYLEIFALSGLTTDEAIAPTRGNNWDDNGNWRVFHQQKWAPNNPVIRDCFNHLGGVVFAATDLLQYNPSLQQQAEARFLRAFAMYWLLDLFDEVPYRDPGENLILPARVRRGTEALNYIISEVNAVEQDLPDGPAGKANKYAAKVLLMKCYLNKAVYTNRVNPMHDAGDMNVVISLADSIINSDKYEFSESYFDNFSPDNSTVGKENIFTQVSNFDGNYALSFAWQIVLGYTQYPNEPPVFSVFNGFTTLSDFYAKFEPTDKRRGIYYPYPNSLPNPGHRVNVGFLIGQQYDLNTDTLISGLIYSPEVHNVEPGPNLLTPGIRPLKYAPDFLNFNYFPPASNEFVYFRIPDVLLMKAEAILRGGTGTIAGSFGDNAKSIVNAIRTHPSRGASALSSVSLDDVYNERGRELWWENWRRQDMIRFGKFLLPFEEKEYQSDTKYLVFPIPDNQLAVNPNLKQNPGY